MKNRFMWIILFLSLLFSITSNGWAQGVLPSNDSLNASIMRPDRETRHKWKEDYKKAPRAVIDEVIKAKLLRAQSESVSTSVNLLDYIQYTPSERNQGSCGNCWVWAGTGIMELALGVQNVINDRFSIQFLNSCKNDYYACCGGNLTGFIGWYGGQGFSIPWANPNASYADGSRQCSNNSSLVPCGSISVTPDYPITSIQEQAINTMGISQSTAIDNIKNILNQNKGVWFAFYLANQTDWNAFFNFWNNQSESILWNPDLYCGHTWNDLSGGGHAVVIIGYNDDDPDPANHYWIVLNSWGTAGGKRPNGLFRMPMEMNYDCTYYDPPYYYYSREFETINVTFNDSDCTYFISPTSQSFSASAGFGSVSVTTQSDCKWTATSNVSWITITFGSSGTGNGSVVFSVDANTGSSRIGTMTIAGKTFTVNQSAPAPTINVTSPNGGEFWEAGTTHSITWTYTGNPGSSVKIELFKGGILNRSITSRTSTSRGYYNWTIPSTQVQGDDYSVKVTTTTNSSYYDTSNSVFTIVGPPPPSITVTYPNGGENLIRGSTQAITWTYKGNPGSYVKIELFKGGILNRTITSRTSTSRGYYNWTIPSTQTQGNDYKIKITSTSNSSINDISDGDFSI
jgi:C1A family cysteine protease